MEVLLPFLIHLVAFILLACGVGLVLWIVFRAFTALPRAAARRWRGLRPD